MDRAEKTAAAEALRNAMPKVDETLMAMEAEAGHARAAAIIPDWLDMPDPMPDPAELAVVRRDGSALVRRLLPSPDEPEFNLAVARTAEHMLESWGGHAEFDGVVVRAPVAARLTVHDVNAEAQRRINPTPGVGYSLTDQINVARAGTEAERAAMNAWIDPILAAARRLKAMEAIPVDYADDRWWGEAPPPE